MPVLISSIAAAPGWHRPAPRCPRKRPPVPDDPPVADRVLHASDQRDGGGPGGSRARHQVGERPPAQQRGVAVGHDHGPGPALRASRSRSAPRGRSRPGATARRAGHPTHTRPGSWPPARRCPTTTASRRASSRAAARTWPSMRPAADSLQHLGGAAFIRVPSPAARTMTAAGALMLTRCSSVLLPVAGSCAPFRERPVSRAGTPAHVPDSGRIPPGQQRGGGMATVALRYPVVSPPQPRRAQPSRAPTARPASRPCGWALPATSAAHLPIRAAEPGESAAGSVSWKPRPESVLTRAVRRRVIGSPPGLGPGFVRFESKRRNSCLPAQPAGRLGSSGSISHQGRQSRGGPGPLLPAVSRVPACPVWLPYRETPLSVGRCREHSWRNSVHPCATYGRVAYGYVSVFCMLPGGARSRARNP